MILCYEMGGSFLTCMSRICELIRLPSQHVESSQLHRNPFCVTNNRMSSFLEKWMNLSFGPGVILRDETSSVQQSTLLSIYLENRLHPLFCLQFASGTSKTSFKTDALCQNEYETNQKIMKNSQKLCVTKTHSTGIKIWWDLKWSDLF